MTPTKQKIISAAIYLFNEHGLANVRLQQIADEVGISIGNLAYHFSTKEIIVCTAFEPLQDKFGEVLQLYSLYPNLLDLDVQMSKLFTILKEFKFCFLDLLEIQRSYPELYHVYQNFVSKLGIQLKKRIEFNQKREILYTHIAPHTYQQLTQAIILSITHWVSQETLSGETYLQEKKFREAIWFYLKPYLTEKGQDEFHALIKPLFL